MKLGVSGVFDKILSFTLFTKNNNCHQLGLRHLSLLDFLVKNLSKVSYVLNSLIMLSRMKRKEKSSSPINFFQDLLPLLLTFESTQISQHVTL